MSYNPLSYLRDCVRLLLQIKESLRRIEDLLERSLDEKSKVSRPGPVGYVFQFQGENQSMGTLNLTFAPAAASDVTNGGQRELMFQINQGTPIVQPLPGNAVESEAITCELNDRVSGTLVDIDSSGNRSQVGRDFDLLIDRDNVAPATPGEVGFRFNADSNTPTV